MGYSRAFCTLITFIASGLFHEWLWASMFFCPKGQDESESSECFDYQIGKSMLFFGWNGFVITLEYIFGGIGLFQWIKSRCPRPIITILILLTALPFGHLFTGDWIEGGYFRDASIGLPMIVRLNPLSS